MKKLASILLVLLTLSAAGFAELRQGKIIKWENGTYADTGKKKQVKNWIIYQLQTETTTYSIARQKETKPQLQAGEIVQYELKDKGTRVNLIDANGKKHDYRIVGQTTAPVQ